MPKNRVIYWGIVILLGTVLLWLGAQLTKRIEWILPYTGVIGFVMIAGGFVYELWKSRARKHSNTQKNR